MRIEIAGRRAVAPNSEERAAAPNHGDATGAVVSVPQWLNKPLGNRCRNASRRVAYRLRNRIYGRRNVPGQQLVPASRGLHVHFGAALYSQLQLVEVHVAPHS